MSYGEPTLLPDYGRFVDLVDEVTLYPYNFGYYSFIFAFDIECPHHCMYDTMVKYLGCEQAPYNICQ